MTPTLALVPLDERPVNTRYPQMLGAIAGAQVLLPPAAVLGHRRTPADLPALDVWLESTARLAQEVIVSCDFYGFGNLINARISQSTAAQALARLARLGEINTYCPVHAFSLITRVANANNAVEEPEYWAEWGTQCYAYARRLHQQEQGALDAAGGEELTALHAALPPAVRADWLARRLRNHTVNLGLLDMAARGALASLLLTSDDTSPWGLPSRERDWLQAWARMTEVGAQVHMYPGADEVGSALVAARLNAHASYAPAVWICWAIDADAVLVAPYEDRPARDTVRAQIAACGCAEAARAEDADFVLGVVPPSPRRADYQPQFLEEDRPARTAPYAEFINVLAMWQAQGKPVALADVAYPNGSDPLLMAALLAPECPLDLGALAAYGAWNTAGNTLGVVVAQACCARFAGTDAERTTAQQQFLAHRFLEDWGYQSVVRRAARDHCAERCGGRREPAAESAGEQEAVCAFIAAHLADALRLLQARGVGRGLRIAPGSVRLPWGRTFEVDFVLEQMPPIG